MTTESYSFEIVSRHRKHRSCSYRGNTVRDITDDEGNVTWAAIEIAKVVYEREAMEDCGGGGNLGGGGRDLILIVTDEEGEEVEEVDLLGSDTTWRERYPLPDGVVSPETVAELAEPVWDGNNHTEPDVSSLAAFAGLDSFGHWDAGDWLSGYHPGDDEDADDIVAGAAQVGVHLYTSEVEKWLGEYRNDNGPACRAEEEEDDDQDDDQD